MWASDIGDSFRFLHVSTDEVFGSLQPHESGFSETTAYKPNSPYSASKAASDHLVRCYYETFGLPTLVTNCSNNYGPYQHAEKFIPTVLHSFLKGQKIPVYGDGQQIRDWLFVEDHCDALMRVLATGAPGESYNIGGNCEKTNLQLIASIYDELKRVCPGLLKQPLDDYISFVEDRLGHDRRYAIDAAKMRSELKWVPAHDFAARHCQDNQLVSRGFSPCRINRQFLSQAPMVSLAATYVGFLMAPSMSLDFPAVS